MQQHGASKCRVIQNIPLGRPHTLQGQKQQGIEHREEVRDPVPASRPSYSDEKGSNPGGESIAGRGCSRRSTFELFRNEILKFGTNITHRPAKN